MSDTRSVESRLSRIEAGVQRLLGAKGHNRILNVCPGEWGRCRGAKGCKRKSAFMIFGGDGKPLLSRLETAVCGTHLPHAIRKLSKKENGSS